MSLTSPGRLFCGRSHKRSDSTYGVPRIQEDLIEDGFRVSPKRVARLKGAAGIRESLAENRLVQRAGPLLDNQLQTWSNEHSRPLPQISSG